MIPPTPMMPTRPPLVNEIGKMNTDHIALKSSFIVLPKECGRCGKKIGPGIMWKYSRYKAHTPRYWCTDCYPRRQQIIDHLNSHDLDAGGSLSPNHNGDIVYVPPRPEPPTSGTGLIGQLLEDIRARAEVLPLSGTLPSGPYEGTIHVSGIVMGPVVTQNDVDDDDGSVNIFQGE